MQLKMITISTELIRKGLKKKLKAPAIYESLTENDNHQHNHQHGTTFSYYYLGKLDLSSDTRLDLRIHLGGKVHACLVESFLDHFATSYSLALDFAALGVPAY